MSTQSKRSVVLGFACFALGVALVMGYRIYARYRTIGQFERLVAAIHTSNSQGQSFAGMLANGKNAAMIAQHMRHPTFQAELQKAKAAGLPTTLAEIFPKMPPANENAAPIYLNLEKLFPVEKQEDDVLSVTKPGPHTKNEWSAARAFISSHADLLSAIHKAASLPFCVMPRRDYKGDPNAIMCPEFAPMRRADRLLNIESLVLEKDGKPMVAVNNETLCFKIADHAANDHFIVMSLLVSDSIESYVLHGMQDILVLNSANPSVCAAIEQAIDKHVSDRSAVPALKDQFAFDVAETQYIWKSGPQALVDEAGFATRVPAPPMSPNAFNALMDANGTYLLKLQSELINAFSLPYPQASTRCEQLIDESENSNDLSTFLSAILNIGYRPSQHARVSADFGITRAAAAVFVYKSKHGSYPNTLSDAIPNVPIDPYNLKPLGYRRDGNGFVVYSVGETGQYDGSPYNPSDPDPKKRFEEVFRYPQTAH